MRRLPLRALPVAVAVSTAIGLAVPSTASAATSYPSDNQQPNLVTLLRGYNQVWQSDGKNDLHGTVLNSKVLSRNDKLTVWINNNATAGQRFRALQNAEYDNGSSYDQSITIADALGSVLAPIYVKGRESGALPLTSALINSSNGTSGAFVSTGTAKTTFSYPRPFLRTDASAAPTAGDAAGCAPSKVNGSSLTSIRLSRPYADRKGNLKIKRVPDTVDTTHVYSPNDVSLTADYGSTGICTGGSFPSGHTTTAYQAGITLATLLPELAPEILARTSEAGNSRIVLGVHYPIDIMGGRIDGEAALATRWSDPAYRKGVLEPARKELVKYLRTQCGGTITACASRGSHYYDNPYGGRSIPGGTNQIVDDRDSAVSTYTERLTYGLPKVGSTRLRALVPDGAENLLLTAYPTLTSSQRASILAQTEIRSGSVLDTTAEGDGSWQRLNLAAATSATVLVKRNGKVQVISTGGKAKVIGRS